MLDISYINNREFKKNKKFSINTFKFRGALKELKIAVSRIEAYGQWRDIKKNGQLQFTCADGGVLNFWPSTGTLTFQGKNTKWDFRRMLLQELDSFHRNPVGSESMH